MKFKIGIFGSAENFDKSLVKKAQEIGRLLSKKDTVLITGATSGLPYFASHEASKANTEIWGYSYELNLKKIKQRMSDHDTSIYKKLVYIPKEFSFASDIQVCRKYRNVISTANCDAGIIISGRFGTLNEFTNLYDMGKIIGVLTGTGGIADELSLLCKKISKKSKAIVIFENQPEKLIDSIIRELRKRA